MGRFGGADFGGNEFDHEASIEARHDAVRRATGRLVKNHSQS